MSDFRLWKLSVLCILFLLFAGAAGVSAGAPVKDRITVVYCSDCVPFQFQDEQGRPAGMLIDLWRLWAKKTGIAVDFQAALWNETLARVKAGKVKVHAGLFYSDERSRYLDFGTILTRTDTNVFLQRDLPSILTVDDLAGYQIGVLAGDYVEAYLKKRLPAHAVIPYPDFSSLMTDLKDSRLKAFASDTPTGIYHLKQSGLLSKFKIFSTYRLYSNAWHIAVTKGNRALLDRIERGFAQIPAAARKNIVQHWTGLVSAEDKAEITVTPDEVRLRDGGPARD